MTTSPNEHSTDPLDDPRVLELVTAYVAELDAGRFPQREDYLLRYPELADAVESCLDGMELARQLEGSADGSETAATVADSPAEPLGDFRILRELGRGGMGVVYEAEQLSLGRRVALKVLPFAAALDERQRRRFQLEAHAAAQLQHPNLVPVYAVGCDRGVHYYAMQLIEGRSVAHWITDQSDRSPSGDPATASDSRRSTRAGAETQPFRSTARSTSPKQQRFHRAVEIALHVAEALDHAHVSGVIHRDVKPSNILIDHQGKPWVTDFGLAQVAASSSMTRTGDLLGTLRYMSPEQAAGERAPVDPRCDVYSLGATLYEMLAGQPMIAGDSPREVLNVILNREPPLLRNCDPTIPSELEIIVLKATAKSPMDRYASAADLAQDLRNFLEQRPILAKRPTVLEHVRKWMRRHPSWVAAALVALAVGVLGMAAALAAVSHEQANTRRALRGEQQRTQQAERRLEWAQRASDEMISLAEFELDDDPRSAALRESLLLAALRNYDAFLSEQPDAEAADAFLATRKRVQEKLDELHVLEFERRALLMLDTRVREDLELTADQAARVQESLRRRPWRGRRPNARRENMLAEAERIRDEMRDLLTPAQSQRLKQIHLQTKGPGAFHDSSVIAALQLSDTQRARIRALESETRWDRQPPRGGPPGDRPRRDPRREPGLGQFRPRRDGPGEGPRAGPDGRFGPPHFFGPADGGRETLLMESCLKVLTPDQLDRWRTMVGETFASADGLRR